MNGHSRLSSSLQSIHNVLFILSSLLLLLLQQQQVSSQSIQGYIYWDTNSNGILDFDSTSSSSGGNGNNNNNGGGGGELENGIIDVQVEVKTCNSLFSSSNNNNEEDVIIAKGKTTWPSTFPNEQIIPGHSAIYPNGGYYKLNLEGRDDDDMVRLHFFNVFDDWYLLL